MPEDTDDTNTPQPEPEPEPGSEDAAPKPNPGDTIDLTAIERAQRIRESQSSSAFGAPPTQRGPSDRIGPDKIFPALPGEERPAGERPAEPEPPNQAPPLWSRDPVGRRPDVGGPPLPPTPGAHTPHAGPGAHAPLPTPSDPPTHQDGEPTTRLLCASMHLQASFAAHAADSLLNDSMQAIAPVWGLDPVALVRHARVSNRLWAERDRELRVVVPAVLVGLFLLLISFLGSWLPWQLELLLLVLLPTGAWCYAWAIIYQHYRDARARALGVMDPRLPARDWAALDVDGPVLSDDEQQRLEDLARANAVTSGGAWPFVGDGQRIGSWTLTVDLEKGSRGPDGQRLAPGIVAPLDLHKHLLTAVPQLAPSTLHAQHRLYVRGPAAPTVPGMMPNPPGPSPQPFTRVDPKLVEQYAEKPTPAARSYVVFQRVLWGGQIVVSLIVRVERQRNTLFIEASEHVLPPLRATFHDVTLLPKDSSRVRRDLLFASFYATRKQTFRAWGRWFENRRAAKADAEANAQTLADYAHGMPMNHGRTTSLREEVGDIGRLNYFGVAEETLAIVALRRRLFEAVEAYLGGHQIDVTDLKRQIDVIALSLPVTLNEKSAQSATLGSNVAG